MSDWQPIETAPKTADVVLLYCENEGVMPGYWFDMAAVPYWVSVETQSLSQGRMLATHWMPLPSPPTQVGTGNHASMEPASPLRSEAPNDF